MTLNDWTWLYLDSEHDHDPGLTEHDRPWKIESESDSTLNMTIDVTLTLKLPLNRTKLTRNPKKYSVFLYYIFKWAEGDGQSLEDMSPKVEFYLRVSILKQRPERVECFSFTFLSFERNRFYIWSLYESHSRLIPGVWVCFKARFGISQYNAGSFYAIIRNA